MDIIWILVAFGFGYLAKQVKLPPLVGYLAAGFILHTLGFKPDSSLEVIASFGVTLLLFTIGLKLNIRTLFKNEVWLGASVHMGLIVLITTLNCLILGGVGIAHFTGLDWQGAALIGFAVSFSSTVFAVKLLEDRGELRVRHGQVAIGILIIQDIAAVVFVSLTAGHTPSLWALTLLLLPLARPIFNRLLEQSGHGELLPLAGFFFAFSAGFLFEVVGLEAHLGALVIGALLSNHGKSTELAKSLLGFKDLFLIAFFLSIGFTALPSADMLVAALIMAIALPVKALLLFLWLSFLKLRSRTSFLAALSLANYSEFGLIVCSVSVANGLLPKEWLVVMALAVAMSFVFASLVNVRAHELHSKWCTFIKYFERDQRLADDSFSKPEKADLLIVGMGRIGTGTFDRLKQKSEYHLCGIDVDSDLVAKHNNQGRRVIKADAEDPDFWTHIDLKPIKMIMLAIPNYLDILEISKQLDKAGYQGKKAGIARYLDEEKALMDAGVDVIFNFYQKAGIGFADQSIHLIND
ncbi:MAG: cation:proton antiporter [Enterobacterales bacterium]|nr:cation:proton antiporter [Enterobacterales bacterium]